MRYTFRSKLLIFIGKYLYGDPRAFGVDCSADEFYALENERAKANPNLHPATAGHWNNMKSQLYKNEMRLTVFKHVSYISVILAFAILGFGNMANKGFVFVGDKVAQVKANYKAEQQAKNQLNTFIDDLTQQQKNMIESWNAKHDKKAFSNDYYSFIQSLDSKAQVAVQMHDSTQISHGSYKDFLNDAGGILKPVQKIKSDSLGDTLDFDQYKLNSLNEMINRIKASNR